MFQDTKRPPEQYGEVEGDGSGDGRYATKMQLQFLNYALVSSFSQIDQNKYSTLFAQKFYFFWKVTYLYSISYE